MAKGKFTGPHKDGDNDLVRKFSHALQEDETAPLPKPTANPLDDHDEKPKDDSDRNMPEWDFQSFLNFDQNPDLNFPELTALDTQSEESQFKDRFDSIPPSFSLDDLDKPLNTVPPDENRIPDVPAKRNRPAFGFWKKSGKKLLIGLTAAAAVVALGFGGFALYRNFSDPYNHQILEGVTVAGVNLGGMSKEQAQQALAAAVDPILSSQNMVISFPDQSLTLSPANTKVTFRADEAAKDAYNYGRTGSRKEQKEDYLHVREEPYVLDLKPYLNLDENYILRELRTYANSFDSNYIPSSYALEGEQPPLDLENFSENNPPQMLLLILGNPGLHLEPYQALQEIIGAYSRLDMNPELSMHSGNSAPESLDLNQVFAEYNIEPVNSSMDPETFDIIPGSYGYTFDLQKARRMLEDAHYGDTIRIPMEYVKPDVMDDQVYFRDVLGTATTPHGNNENRNANLALACKALNGLVLNPGDEFSYNAALGQRTAEKGYKAAPAYSGDQLVDSLGGGICQVSSTLYYSCLLADLQITDRVSHGFLPSYIDPGMDATVSWGAPDFKFRNNSEFPIQIQAETTEDKVIIKILGTDTRDYYIKMEYEMSNIAPNEVYEEHDADSGYYDGQVINAGTVGHYVKTYRCKYSKQTNVLLSREFEARSSYMSRNRVIAVVKDDSGETVPSEPADPTEPEITDPTKPVDPTPTDPSTPEPSTPEPSTPEPSTPEPSTPEPSTPEPSTPEPSTPEPSTPEPSTPEPSAPEPSTPAPSTPDPGTPAPSTPAPDPESEA